MVPEPEARYAMALPKWGHPQEHWHQQRARASTITNAFGLLDAAGAAIPGLQVEFAIVQSRRVAADRFLFTLRRYEFGRLLRLYQQDINLRPGLRPKDHASSHEHVGQVRVQAGADWSRLAFAQAVERFCSVCSLTLSERLPDFEAFELR